MNITMRKVIYIAEMIMNARSNPPLIPYIFKTISSANTFHHLNLLPVNSFIFHHLDLIQISLICISSPKINTR